MFNAVLKGGALTLQIFTIHIKSYKHRDFKCQGSFSFSISEAVSCYKVLGRYITKNKLGAD